MRHRKKGKSLGRKTGPRKALLKGLCRSLILNGKIVTTERKAKSVKPVFEKLLTKAIKSDLVSLRRINSFLQDIEVTKKLIEEIAPKYKDRPGGYTRIIKLGKRKGDGAKKVLIELV
ncbi:MAG TPA: 50S ribosomal protein L17 [Patescibacteria group bacterium]|nr:50S ribosomal protein L17 [Patescibacteria group bacterium]